MQATRHFVKQNNIYLIYCFIVFFMAQLLYALAHAGFYTNYYSALTQVATAIPAIDVIHQHFWQSLYYYHIAPPLYFLYAFGFALLFPPDGQLGIYILHTILGLLAVYALYRVQERLGINKKLAVFLITLFLLSPSFNLYQTMGWYDFPVACLLLISTWCFIQLYDAPSFKRGCVFFGIIALLCGIRSLYHVNLYFVPLIILTLFFIKVNRKQVLLSCLIPFIFVFSMYFKNYMLFDAFTINSFSGEVFANVAMQFGLTLEQRQQGVAQGYFSELALCPQSADTIPFKMKNMAYDGLYCYKVIAEKYRQHYIQTLGRDYKNIPILNTIPGSFYPQRNVLGNIGMDQEYQKNAIQSLKHFPLVYLKSVLNSWRIYFVDSPDYFYQNMVNIRHLPESLRMNLWSYNHVFHKLIYNKSDVVSVALLCIYPFLIIFSLGYFLFARAGLVIFSFIYWLFVLPGMIHYLNLFVAIHIFNGSIQSKMVVCLLTFTGFLAALMILFRSTLSLLAKKKRAVHYQRLITPPFEAGKRVFVFYLFSNITFTTMIINFIAANEQQRYRFYIDGLYLIIFGLMIQTLFCKPEKIITQKLELP